LGRRKQRNGIRDENKAEEIRPLSEELLVSC
jgi:hypothetical protein